MAWFPKQRVLVPFDFSDPSLEAVKQGRELVESTGRLTVVHVLEDLSPVEPGELWNAVEDKERVRNATEALEASLPPNVYGDLKLEVHVGVPAQEIAQAAERLDVELIVMPSHGRTGVRRLLIGSVAERVVRLAHCPVLVLRS